MNPEWSLSRVRSLLSQNFFSLTYSQVIGTVCKFKALEIIPRLELTVLVFEWSGNSSYNDLRLSFVLPQPAFQNLAVALIKVLVMTVGEIDFGNTFIDTIGKNSTSTNNPLNPFPDASFIFISFFLLLMTISLMNLLVGNKTRVVFYPGVLSKRLVGMSGPLHNTLTRLMTKICDFPFPIYDLARKSNPVSDLPYN